MPVAVAFALTCATWRVHAQDAVQPIAYWSFDEGDGTAAQDATGNGHDGGLERVTWSDEGISGSALRPLQANWAGPVCGNPSRTVRTAAPAAYAAARPQSTYA